ncbi:DNA sulfur modification protein DndB [Amycolatopsis silviterrae]|uniref:DNA sulfur modification protein DndB n=1 Tax=Amycolatopsis silviterrae TaxID=1656914 RepID=A0ABW5H859_9PSEU
MTTPSDTPQSSTLDVDKGQVVRVMPVHPNLSLCTMPWSRLSRIVPDPRRAEDPKALQYGSAADREQAALRNDVQRMINKTKKAENAKEYARYIAEGIRGVHGRRWTTPPFALWVQDALEHVSSTGPYGEDYIAILPFDVNGVLVDAETQHLAHIILSEEPDLYGVTKDQVRNRLVAVEIHHGVDMRDARQIFHDRNLLGVIPNKTVALNSDSRDIATTIAFAIMDNINVRHPRTKADVPLRALVSANKRQLGAKDNEWMTLSTLRSFVVTSIFGRAGIELTSAAVSPDELPGATTEESARKEILGVADLLFAAHSEAFNDRVNTIIATPAVLAALGAVAHQSMSWSRDFRRSPEGFIELISDVIWYRRPEIWDGVAGKVTPSGKLSVAGGAKDNGSKTATALEDEASPSYKKIRGQLVNYSAQATTLTWAPQRAPHIERED